ncbi:unnamed protein product, partial [Brenthis ino]
MEESKKINSICEGETTKNRNNDKELTDLDEVLKHELGEFGCFQLRNMVLVALPIVMSAFMSEYIFSSAAVSHRCRIPECGENNMFYDLKPDWILNAVPETSAGISSCQRFDPLNIGINGTLDYCPVSLFNKSIIVTCGTFVYAEDKTVVSDDDSPSLFKNIIQSPILLRRVCTTPMWWITATFVYYGLSINSTSLAGSKYLNYILISAIDIPGNFTSLLVLDKIGRKATLSIAFFFSAACNIAFVYVPKDVYGIRLAVFLLGKFGAAVTMTSTYLFTSELYPTQYRHSLLGFSSMVGRIGSIAAPLTPALMSYWHGIPSMMFGCMGILSGILVLTQPETLGMKMPNTLAEAEALGKSKSKNNK